VGSYAPGSSFAIRTGNDKERISGASIRLVIGRGAISLSGGCGERITGSGVRECGAPKSRATVPKGSKRTERIEKTSWGDWYSTQVSLVGGRDEDCLTQFDRPVQSCCPGTRKTHRSDGEARPMLVQLGSSGAKARVKTAMATRGRGCCGDNPDSPLRACKDKPRRSAVRTGQAWASKNPGASKANFWRLKSSIHQRL